MSTKALLHPAISLAERRTLGREPASQATGLRRVAESAGDLLLLLALIFCVPAVILAIGIPVALLVQLLLWIVRSLA